jgi:hypothetical protein
MRLLANVTAALFSVILMVRGGKGAWAIRVTPAARLWSGLSVLVLAIHPS